MRFNKLWLDELVSNNMTADEVSDIITMAGLEVDSVDPVCGSFTKVVVGEVLTCVDHPDSDHLHVTTVKVGDDEVLDIVCGAPNCRQGLKVACATVGAVLPGDFKIKPCKLRGVPSNGMLCSFKELGLCEESNGIIELPADAPVGMDLHDYLSLNDNAIEVDLTANRADCLSIRGLAREFGVLTKTDVAYPVIDAVDASVEDKIDVVVEAPKACPRYISRVIKNLDITKKSPIWMQEKLRRAGIRSIDAIVDVTNYVMLELGQPMHAFDKDCLAEKIIVRLAKKDEKLVLLSGEEVTLTEDTLVIADANGAVALAGIFGGKNSGVNENTKNIVLESAFFSPSAIKNRARSYGLSTDASHRFERGVDYTIARDAIERATKFILDICGGEAGPLNEVVSEADLPSRNEIDFDLGLVKEVIGIEIEKDIVIDILERLGLNPQVINDSLIKVTSPSWRYDIVIPVDICEEIARIYGYNNIPNSDPVAPLRMVKQEEAKVSTYALKTILANHGYHEVVTYSFVDPKNLNVINPNVKAIELPSPISADMSTMRITLWTGLINAVVYNVNRQVTSLKLFESGLVFIPDENAENGILQQEMIGGVIYGFDSESKWYGKARAYDFYDLKGDVEALLAATDNLEAFTFERCDIPALHPGISAQIKKDGEVVGYAGLIHPSIEKKLGLKRSAFLFELKLSALQTKVIPSYAEVSKYPSIKRDFAIVVDNNVQSSDIISAVKKHGGQLVVDANVFDVFVGADLGEGKKSLAFSIILQTTERTLEDTDITNVSNSIIEGLKNDFNALLRE